MLEKDTFSLEEESKSVKAGLAENEET